MSKEKLSYGEAIEQIEQLIAVIENPKTPLETITGEVKKVLELIKECKAEIAGFARESDALLKEEN